MVLHEYGVEHYLFRSMSSLYDRSRTCVKYEREVGEYFEVRRGLRQVYIISPSLFNIFFDRVVRQVNERATGKGMKMKDKNGRRWEIKQV